MPWPGAELRAIRNRFLGQWVGREGEAGARAAELTALLLAARDAGDMDVLIGLPGRIVDDLRRSGVRHLIRAEVPPHTVMAFSGHRTNSMLKRYDIISMDDLRTAAQQGSVYTGQPAQVVPLRRDNS